MGCFQLFPQGVGRLLCILLRHRRLGTPGNLGSLSAWRQGGGRSGSEGDGYQRPNIQGWCMMTGLFVAGG